jgi:hypothetical protein
MRTVLLVCAAATLFFTLSSCQAIPDVALDDSNCPVGPGIKWGIILIGTEATCRCVVKKNGNSSTQAGWFTQDNTYVGVVNDTDGSSVLTFSFNDSDIYQSFECRLITTPPTAGKGVQYTPQFRSSPSIENKNNSPTIRGFAAPRNVTNITWQVWNIAPKTVNISTCNIASNNCTDFIPEFYNAAIGESGNSTYLLINTSRVNETQFSFVADNGLRSPITELEYYGWPRLMECSQVFTPTYVDITCTAQHVYPSVIAELHREKEDFKQSDFVGNLTCDYGPYPNDAYAEHNVYCIWRIEMKSMWTESNLTAYMYVPVSNVSAIDENPVTVKTTIIYTAPRVELVKNQCDSLDGVLIKRDAYAKCRCQTVPQTYSPGQARWYTNDGQVVGDENRIDWSSTLTVSFNASDPTPTYSCRPFTELQVPVEAVTYMPKFSSSMPRNMLTGLGPMIIVLGIVLSGILSR